MKKYCCATILIMFIFMISISYAQNANNKTSTFKFIFMERFRIEAWDNAVSLNKYTNDDLAYTRNKTSFGLKWTPNSHIEILGKLTNEFKIYLSPKDRPFNGHELFFDQLYFKWKNPHNLPMEITLGRQDIMIGEGFITGDATPLDGSRSFYFNAIRLDYQFIKNHQIIFFIHHTGATDKLLPVIHSQDQKIAEQPETGIFLDYFSKIKILDLDLYYARKNNSATSQYPIESGINAFGSRIKLPLIKDLALVAEGNYQNGHDGINDRSAFGGLLHFDYSLRNRIPCIKMLTLGGIYLTGDNPNNSRMEAWDPLFGRWPKWSESYIYTLTRESRLAYWSNITSLYATLTFDFNNYNVNGYLTYYHLGANQSNPASKQMNPVPFPGGNGKTRGDLLVYRMNYKINKYLNGVCIWEHFWPGNFYFKGANSYNWLRFELMFNY